MLMQIATFLDKISFTFLNILQKEVFYSSILFVIIFIFNRLLKSRSLYLQFGLWTFVFIRLLLPPDLSFRISARSLFTRLDIYQIEIPEHVVERVSITESPGLPSSSNAPPAAADHLLAETKTTDNTNIRALFTWRMALFVLWLCGVAVFTMIFFRRYLHYLNVTKHAKSVEDKKILQIVAGWCRRFAIQRTIRVVSSHECLSPFTIGILRPVVYLPETMLSQSSSATIESVLAHELAHIKNWDDLWMKLQNLVQIVYFFHPVVWLANSYVNQVRERICDELVLAAGSISPKAYGESMLAVLKLNLFGVEGVEMLPSFGNHKKKFSERIYEISKISKIKKTNWAGVTVVLFILGLFLLPMAGRAKMPVADSEREHIIELKKAVNGEAGFKIHTVGAGSKFQCLASSQAKTMFCKSKLPPHLTDMEYAAIGIFDTDFRKFWVLKGKNRKGEIEFYLDTNGDNCFTDESALEVKKKTAKYHLEGDSEWVLAKYLKSQVSVDSKARVENKEIVRKFAVHLVYYPEDNFLEFDNNEFWIGEAKFAGKKYPVALYGGLYSDWFLRASFDENLAADSQNELRIDLNQNHHFENMTVFDPANNEVMHEKYFLHEPFSLNGKSYEVAAVIPQEQQILLKIAERPTSSGEGLTKKMN